MDTNDCRTCGIEFCEHFWQVAATDTMLGAQYRGQALFAGYRLAKEADATGDYAIADEHSFRLAQAQYAAYGDDIA